MAIGYGEPAPKPQATRARVKAKRKSETDWLKVRAEVLLRDGWACRVCSGRTNVQVHHVRFRSTGGGHATSNLACLCTLCHADVHGYRMAISGDANGKLKITRA